MRKKLYAIRDDLTFEFDPPVCCFSDVDFLRMCSNAVSTSKKSFEAGDLDFDPDIMNSSRSAYFIGDYEDGKVYPLSPDGPIFICKLSDCVNYYQKLLVEFGKDDN